MAYPECVVPDLAFLTAWPMVGRHQTPLAVPRVLQEGIPAIVRRRYGVVLDPDGWRAHQ